MKKFLLIISLSLIITLQAKKIICIPNTLNIKFNEVNLKQTSGNKYLTSITKNKNTLLTNTISNSFLRRERISRFRNKNQNIIIKTLKLYPNKVTKTSIQINQFGTYNRFYKLYSK